MHYCQVERTTTPFQSILILIDTDSFEYIAYQLDRFDKLIAEYDFTAFYGGYEPSIILAS
jgi:hypothetical protein